MRNHVKFWTQVSRVALLSILLLALTISGCTGRAATSESIKSGRAFKPIAALSHAGSESEAREAVKNILQQSFSLGVTDEAGNQLNPNVPEDAVSLTPEDIATYAVLSAGGHYRTIDYVVDFLADAGVKLESTGRTITTEDLLPDLQEYVDWSYSHPDDPKSSLGLLLASGSELELPEARKKIEGSTRISSLASLLMLADILIGVEQEAPVKSASLALNQVVSAQDSEEADKKESIGRVKGLITLTEAALNSDLVKGFSAVFLSKEREEQITQIKKYLAVVRGLIAVYEVCDHFAVRIVNPDGSRANFIELDRKGEKQSLEGVVVALVPREGEKAITGIPASFYFHLMSTYRVTSGHPLYEDADAVLAALKDDDTRYKIDLNGHRLKVEIDVAQFSLEATKMTNKDKKTAILYASAELPLHKAENILDEYKGTIGWLGISADEIKKMLNVIGKDIEISPTMSIVTFKAKDDEHELKTYESYYKDGQISQRYTYYLDSSGDKIYHGTLETWYLNGNPSTISEMRDGKMNGMSETYHKNGQLKSRVKWEDGKKEGLYESWHRDGEKFNVGEYKDDKQEGLWEKHNFVVNSWERGEYKDGKREGLWEYWEDDKLKVECEYKGGERLKCYEY